MRWTNIKIFFRQRPIEIVLALVILLVCLLVAWTQYEKQESALNGAGTAAIACLAYQGSESPLACQKPPLVSRLSSSIRASRSAAASEGSTLP